MEARAFARIDALAIGRPTQDKLFFLARGDPQQRLIKTRRFHRVFLIGRYIPVGFIQHHGLFGIFCPIFGHEHTLDIDIEHVAIGAGPRNLGPTGMLFAISFQPRLNLGLIDFKRLFFDTQGAIFAQLHFGF